jgi:F-type H+-transporting ATPase subunit delta
MTPLATLARPYAKAIFALARDQAKLPSFHAALEVAAAMSQQPAIEGAMNDPRADKAQLGAAFAAPNGEAGFNDFIALLIQRGRLPLLAEISQQFAVLRADYEKSLKVRIESAKPIDADQQQALSAALSKRLGRKIELDITLNPELIAGAIVHAGDTVMDGSMAAQLKRLQAQLAA